MSNEFPCQSCGYPNDWSARHCGKCGRKEPMDTAEDSPCPEQIRKPRPGMNEPAASACENPAWVEVTKPDGETIITCYLHSKRYAK